MVKAYLVLDHSCINVLPSPSPSLHQFKPPLRIDTTTTTTNLGKPSSGAPTLPRRPSPLGSSNKLHRSRSPSQFNSNPPGSPPTTRVSSKPPPSPNPAVPNQHGHSATPPGNKPLNATARVQGFFDMLAHGRPG